MRRRQSERTYTLHSGLRCDARASAQILQMLMAQRSRDPDDEYEEEEDFDDEEGEEEAVLLSADTASFYEEERRDANGNLSLTYR